MFNKVITVNKDLPKPRPPKKEFRKKVKKQKSKTKFNSSYYQYSDKGILNKLKRL